nr:T9SS type A sorting domain-containing protein [Saprospiraceae bacterium]
MKTISYLMLFALYLSAMAYQALAQCDFEVEIEGDLMLCPESEGVLFTGTFDSYAWYKRPFSGGDEAEPIPGATDSFLVVNYYEDVPAWFSVEVTLDTCVVRSEEYLLDGYAFLPPFVETLGEFAVGPEGETIICNNDTVQFIFSMDTSIQWYKDFEPIPGATGKELIVSEGGSYFAEGAPEECPDLILQLGLTLEVDKRDVDAVIPQIELEGYELLQLTNPEEFVFWQWFCEENNMMNWIANQDTSLMGHDYFEMCNFGPFLIRSTDRNGCVAWSEDYFTMINSVEEKGLEIGSVYPNPATHFIYLELPEVIEKVEYRIIDLNGKQIRSGHLIGAGKHRLDLSGLSSRQYLIELKEGNKLAVVRVLRLE